MSTHRTLVAAAVALFAAMPAGAQGNLSTQGLGFPPGQLSTKALSMGGAIGEIDPLSPLNPAALSLLITSIIAMQVEPEFREVSFGGKAQKTSVARFPLFFGSMPVGTKWGVGVSASTLLDRTWATSSRDTQVVGPDTIASTISQLSDGSLVDVRLAVSRIIKPWLRVGVGMHAYSGQTSLRTVHDFDDSLTFAADTQRATIGYGGNAFSVGVQTLWPKYGTIGISYRHGGTLRTYNGDDVSAESSAPDHFGLSAVFLGIEGTALGVRVAKDMWSNTVGLSPTLNVHEGLDLGFGADTRGPRFGGGSIAVRAGARFRTLPFSVGPDKVTENSFSGGLGFPLARGRSELNFGLIRSARSSTGGISENAWTFSTGMSVRP